MPDTHDAVAHEVAAFYDQTLGMEIIFGPNIHLGYWPDGLDDSMAEGQGRLTELVGGAIGDAAYARVLDIGCGTGEPARHLAAATGAAVTGVTISAAQVEVARSRSAAARLPGRTEFQVADATALPFADNTFDAAIAIESLMHMPDKASALREALRVLRPGAALVIADLTQGAAEAAADPALAGLIELTAPITLEGYRELAREAGFELEEVRDISEQVHPSYPKLIEQMARLRPELEAADTTRQLIGLVDIFGLLEIASASGQLGYLFLVARKPVRAS